MMTWVTGGWKVLLLRTQARASALPPSLTHIGHRKPHSQALDSRDWETFLAGSRRNTTKGMDVGRGRELWLIIQSIWRSFPKEIVE